MKEQIQILMEETGCDAGQAELALQSCRYNLEKAIRTLGELLRDIVVLKGKFCVGPRYLYGLMCILLDVRKGQIIRVRTLVSYNPHIFEVDLKTSWDAFEKLIYTARLDAGSLQGATQETERALAAAFAGDAEALLIQAVSQGHPIEVNDLIEEALQISMQAASSYKGVWVAVEILDERLNLSQFHSATHTDLPVGAGAAGDLRQGDAPRSISEESAGGAGTLALPSGGLLLEASLEKVEDGIRARELSTGDVVLCVIQDERDIGLYLSKLLGGRKGDMSVPFPSMIEEVEKSEKEILACMRLAPGIFATCRLEPEARVKRVRPAGEEEMGIEESLSMENQPENVVE